METKETEKSLLVVHTSNSILKHNSVVGQERLVRDLMRRIDFYRRILKAPVLYAAYEERTRSQVYSSPVFKSCHCYPDVCFPMFESPRSNKRPMEVLGEQIDLITQYIRSLISQGIFCNGLEIEVVGIWKGACCKTITSGLVGKGFDAKRNSELCGTAKGCDLNDPLCHQKLLATLGKLLDRCPRGSTG